jgi:DNA-binding response OmpR family regulator
MKKVLLIEDDPTMLSLLETLLEIEGFEVKKINDYGSILELVESESPDLVLMDVHLKEVDGLEVLSSMKKDQNLEKVKVIMASGMDYKKQSIQTGANDFIQKPFMPDELVSKIKRLAS